MPWKAFLTDNKYCVFKLDSQRDKTGSSLGCHATREEANRQVAALNVSEDKEQEIKEDEISQDEDSLEKAHLIGIEGFTVPVTITSFADLDAMNEAQEKIDGMKEVTLQFAEMAENVFFSGEVEDKAEALQSLADEFATRVTQAQTKEKWQPLTDKIHNIIGNYLKQETKREGGVDYPRGDYAFTPNGPSTWKLRLSQGSPGNITTSQLGRAAAAFSSGGFRGQRVQIPGGDVSKVKSRIRSEYQKLGTKREDMPDSVKEQSFFIWKEADGYKWLARYSNNIRDEEQEIIASESHQRFVKQVDEGLVPLPELWLWHIKEWKFGEATNVAYDDSGFAVATGTVDRNEAAEDVAGWLAEREDILTSHGMPKRTVKHDEEDESIIIEHETREISPLFDFAAANKFTGFSILKEETDMAIPQHKKDEFNEQGLSAKVLDELEAENAATDKETEELDKKEEVTNPEQSESVADEETPQDNGVSRQEFVETLSEVVKPLLAQVKELTAQVKELSKTDAEKVKEVLEDTPDASLKALTLQSIFGTETLVDGRSSLAKSKPKEKEQSEEPALFFQDWLGSNAGSSVPNLFEEVE